LPISPSFCGTWNPAGWVLGWGSPPVENAVETAAAILSHSETSSRSRLDRKFLIGRKMLIISYLLLFIGG
jgi:hypothetical protein